MDFFFNETHGQIYIPVANMSFDDTSSHSYTRCVTRTGCEGKFLHGNILGWVKRTTLNLSLLPP